MPSASPHDILGEDYYNAIGHLIVAASKLDSLLLDLISIFSGADELSTIIMMGHQQPSSKVESLLALIEMRLGDREAKLTKSVARVSELCEYRNRVVHASWAIDEAGEIVAVRFTARRRLVRTRKPTPANQIETVAREADALAVTLARLRECFAERSQKSSLPH